MRARWFLALGTLSIASGATIVAACGGSDLTLCGAGTVNVDGVCVIAPTDGSSPDVVIPADGDTPDQEAPADDATADVPALPDAGSSDASDSGAPNRCPYGKGSVMAEIPNPGSDAGSFCIDSTEATEAQYDQFLKAKNGNTGGQILECSWNTNYAPECQGFYTFNPGTNPQLPVRCVDWCDAKAYCEWAGKKLCDQLDKSSGPNRDTSRAYWTCTNGNGTTYPQGASNDNTCWQPGSVDAGPVKVASVGCKGKFAPYDQTNDLLGNIDEWQSYCDPDSGIASVTHQCKAFGGSFLQPDNFQGCNAPSAWTAWPRAHHSVGRGIRCCAD